MKLLSTLVLSALLFVQSPILETSRSTFTHEILSVTFENDGLKIKGWGLLQNKQHFLGVDTHDFKLKFKGGEHEFIVDTNLWNANLTTLLEYRGWQMCDALSMNAASCNYNFKNVGFETLIPYSLFRVDEDYEISLIIDAKIIGTLFESPVHFYENTDTEIYVDSTVFVLNTNVRQASFKVFEDDVVVRSKPYQGNNTETVDYDTCSSSYGKTAFFTKGSVYQSIKSVVQNGLVKSYEVEVNHSLCDGLRNRVVEGTDKRGFIQSVFIDYASDSLRLSVSRMLKDPELIASDQSIFQYGTFNPREFVTAIDEYGEDDSDSVDVFINRTNPRIPGIYDVEYRYKTLTKSIAVSVIPVEVMYRYVNEKTKDHLVLWNREDFVSILYALMKPK